MQLEFDAQCATNCWHALVYGWQICQRVIITQDGSNVQVEILSHTSTKIISKDLYSSREPTQWSLRRSIGEARIGIILCLQHQPCGEVDIILPPCGLWSFKCNMDFQNQSNYQNQSNCCRDMNSTMFSRRKEGTEQDIMCCDPTNVTFDFIGSAPSAVHYKLTHMDINMLCISIW